MVQGSATTSEPAADPFAHAEQRTRAVLSAPWWSSTPPAQRGQVLADQVLALPDRSRWFFGRGARWHRWHPDDSEWYISWPPCATLTRRSAQVSETDTPPIPVHLLPTGPDFETRPAQPMAIAGPTVPDALTFRLRQIIDDAALAPPADYPLRASLFTAGTPSTVAVTWATMLWCASVPAFDPDEDARLLDLWRPYLDEPLEENGRLRMIVPPLLKTLVRLYADRLRTGRADAAGQLVRFMVMVAQTLRDDRRFKARASALMAMLEPLLANPALDQQALTQGNEAVEREWVERCPAALAAALNAGLSGAERFQLTCYDLAKVVRPLCGHPDRPAFTEPRQAAVALLAADMAGYRPDLAEEIGDRLDPELRELLGAVLGRRGHPLRRLWPSRGRLPEGFRPPDGKIGYALMSASAAVAFAWCRLAGGIPIPADGFTVPDACATEMDALRTTARRTGTHAALPPNDRRPTGG